VDQFMDGSAVLVDSILVVVGYLVCGLFV
jgi:hypothetical protein